MAGGQAEGGSWQRPLPKRLNGRRPLRLPPNSAPRGRLASLPQADSARRRRRPGPPTGAVPLAIRFRPRASREHRGLAARSARRPPAVSWPPQAPRPGRTHSARAAAGRGQTKARRPGLLPATSQQSPSRDCAPRPGLPIGPRTLLAGGVILPQIQPMPLGHPRTPRSGRLGRKEEERLRQPDPRTRGPRLNSRGPPPLPPPQPAPCGPNQELKWRPRRRQGLRARLRGGRAGVVRAHAVRRRELPSRPLYDWLKWLCAPRGLLPFSGVLGELI